MPEEQAADVLSDQNHWLNDDCEHISELYHHRNAEALQGYQQLYIPNFELGTPHHRGVLVHQYLFTLQHLLRVENHQNQPIHSV